MIDYEKIATVLEKTADYLDAQEHEKQASVSQARQQQLSTLAQKYAQATGEDVPSSFVEKLAASDDDLISAFQKLAARTGDAGEPDALGEPDDSPDREPVYTTKKAALAARERAAGDRFLDWVLND